MGWMNQLSRRTRLKWVAGLLLMVGLTPYFYSRLTAGSNRVGVFKTEARSPNSPPTQAFEIVAFNIAHGRGPTDSNWEESGNEKHKRVAEIAAFLKQTKADVVVLNEVDFNSTWSGGQNQAQAIAEQAGYHYRVEQRNLDFGFIYGSWRFGNAVLSRFPIREARVVDFPELAAWESWLVGHKRGVVCTIEVGDEQRVDVLAVHIETRSQTLRKDCAKQMIQLATTSDHPLLLAGDFNSIRSAIEPQPPISAVDLLADSSKFQFPKSPAKTFPSHDPNRTIDWILPTMEMVLDGYKVLDTDLSDHLPVAARVTFASAAASED